MNSNEEDEFEVGAGIKSINLMAEKDQLTNTNSSKADLEKNLKMLDGIGKNLALKNKIENQRKSDQQAPFNSDESSEVKPKFKTRRDYIKSRNAAKDKSK